MKIVNFIAIFNIFVFWDLNAYAAFVKNTDTKPQSIVIIEASSRRDIVLQAEQEIGICLKGCFVTLPNGDRFYIKANETLELNNDRASFK